MAEYPVIRAAARWLIPLEFPARPFGASHNLYHNFPPRGRDRLRRTLIQVAWQEGCPLTAPPRNPRGQAVCCCTTRLARAALRPPVASHPSRDGCAAGAPPCTHPRPAMTDEPPDAAPAVIHLPDDRQHAKRAAAACAADPLQLHRRRARRVRAPLSGRRVERRGFVRGTTIERKALLNGLAAFARVHSNLNQAVRALNTLALFARSAAATTWRTRCASCGAWPISCVRRHSA